jgi:hypothetical protein
MADQRRRECFLDLALYAPVGLALTIGDHLPGRVRRGAAAFGEQVRVARAFGELAVRFGRAEIERELRAERTTGAADEVVPLPTDLADGASTDERASVAVADSPSTASLPISDYENLAAIHVVQRLGSLRDDEIEQIRRFELAHRARRTILAKIDSLQEPRTT